jgi:beta-glucosidase
MAPGATVKYDDGTVPSKAGALAATTDVAIVFVSQWASEGMDLPTLSMTDVVHKGAVNWFNIVTAVAAANPHTIVVMENGGAQTMAWLDKVPAVLEAWYPGQRGGEAIARILFGAVNPSGKLPVTFPASDSDLPRPRIDAGPNDSAIFPVDYSEGLLVGYKWFDAKNIAPQFPFGFGLSYTTFSITNVSVAGFQVVFDIANTGRVAGAEVAQIYIGFPDAAAEPPKRLVAWKKAFLQPGEKQRVTVQIDPGDSSHPLSIWDTETKKWETVPGDYTVYVGNSSAPSDLIRAGTIRMST